MMDSETRQLRDAFTVQKGYWSDAWNDVLTADPAFFAAWLEFSEMPFRRRALDLKSKHLICIAVNASPTLLHSPSTREHIRQAIKAGASAEEVLEVLELIAMLGIHTITEGLPILDEELARAGKHPGEHDPVRSAAIKQRFIAEKGYWSPFWDALLRLDPAFFEAWIDFSLLPIRKGPLDMKMVHLVYVAADVSATHLYNAGTRIHMRGAIECGATPEEILEVLELAMMIGAHTMTESAGIFRDEFGLRATSP